MNADRTPEDSTFTNAIGMVLKKLPTDEPDVEEDSGKASRFFDAWADVKIMLTQKGEEFNHT